MNTGGLIVATPDPKDPAVQGVPESHVTMVWFGEAAALPPELILEIQDDLDGTAVMFDPFQADVAGVAMIGPDKAHVMLIESQTLVDIRMELISSSAVRQAYALAERQFPNWIPHLTMSYEGQMPQEWPGSVRFDSLGLWLGETHDAYPLGSAGGDWGAMAAGGDLIVPVRCLADLDTAIMVATANPSGRWYVSKRARALGAENRVPASWHREVAHA